MNATAHNPIRTLAVGTAGAVASGGSLAVSLMSKFELGLRVSALALGCLVSLATIISLLPKVGAGITWLRRQFQNPDHE